MTYEVDMTNAGDFLTGVNLWRIVACSIETSKNSGDPYLKLTLRNGMTDLVDMAMLRGKGWPIGRKKLLGLGIPADHKGGIDPLAFVDRRLWVATHVVTESYVGKDGQTKSVDKLKVDINQLKHAGYQPEADLPQGCVAPPPDDVDSTPF